jgi:hypothetical protein
VVAAIHHVVNRPRILDAQLASHKPKAELSTSHASRQQGNMTLSLTDTFLGGGTPMRAEEVYVDPSALARL